MFTRKRNKKGQATTELAIMGSIVIMLLAYLVTQGYIYNARQSLEMYAFRKALELSRGQERGIDLTVIRDVFVPSFFSGFNRQRLMAQSSVEHNPWKVWIPKAEDPEDVPTRKLIQLNDGMIKQGYFFEVPPTKATIVVPDSGDPKWINSPISEIDPQNKSTKSTYTNYTAVVSSAKQQRVGKVNASTDTIPTAIVFERDEDRIRNNYLKDDWKGEISSVDIDEGTIPKDVNLILEETVTRDKDVRTEN